MEGEGQVRRAKVLTGQVIAVRPKTIVVRIRRIYRIPKYGKLKIKYKKCHAHDERNIAKIGETVSIRATRARSALKRWSLIVPNSEVSSSK
ncbi:uS17 family ribosomal protein [Mycoplasma suis]|uniref:30S ribosomal protein S17 n=1 Tax=Mycoplasma suis (strain KI_3806) TaxID=708248 RepID=F0V3N9_MYCS3|nr:30S ribosomal protein S17 [Mycoplasma suis]CBZ40461.1 30S ribosomal protein S17 [Mycoplasma suis KI3806]